MDKTLVSGAIFKFEGQVGVFNHLMNDGKRSGTYRCLFPQAPSADDSPGVQQPELWELFRV